MKTSGFKGFVVSAVTKVAVVSIVVLALVGVQSTGLLSFMGLESDDHNSLSILVNEAMEGRIINSYSNEDEGSVVTMVEIDSALSRIGELATVSYGYSGVTFSSDSRQIMDWDVPLTRNMVAVEYEGVIRAGYVVSDIEYAIDDESQTITVTLPTMEVFSNEISVQGLDWQDNPLNHISPDAATNLLDEARYEELEAAYDSGLAQEAEDSAETIITDVLSKICDYEIVFETSHEWIGVA